MNKRINVDDARHYIKSLKTAFEGMSASISMNPNFPRDVYKMNLDIAKDNIQKYKKHFASEKIIQAEIAVLEQLIDDVSDQMEWDAKKEKKNSSHGITQKSLLNIERDLENFSVIIMKMSSRVKDSLSDDLLTALKDIEHALGQHEIRFAKDKQFLREIKRMQKLTNLLIDKIHTKQSKNPTFGYDDGTHGDLEIDWKTKKNPRFGYEEGTHEDDGEWSTKINGILNEEDEDED